MLMKDLEVKKIQKTSEITNDSKEEEKEGDFKKDEIRPVDRPCGKSHSGGMFA